MIKNLDCDSIKNVADGNSSCECIKPGYSHTIFGIASIKMCGSMCCNAGYQNYVFNLLQSGSCYDYCTDFLVREKDFFDRELNSLKGGLTIEGLKGMLDRSPKY